MYLKIGDKAPLFSLPDQSGKVHKLGNYLGQWVLVYFYPKDNTPGCTIEACALRDAFPKFEKLQAKIFGISADSQASHENFVQKHQLNFTLLSDEDKTTLKKYGVWGEKSFLGKKYRLLKISYQTI